MKSKKMFFIVVIIGLIVTVDLKSSPLLLVGYPGQNPEIDSLRSALFFPGDENFSFAHKQFFLKNTFYDLGLVYSINIYKGHPDLKYKLWMQPKPAPIVVILPGTGSFYSSSKIIALAELFYLKGYSVLAISDVFNWQFSESASSVRTPGFTPVDSADMYYALCKIFSSLDEKYKNKITDKMLVGFSLGALHALFIADLESKLQNNKLGFSRYLALNPPVDLLYAVHKIDDFYSAGNYLSREQLTGSISKGLQLYQKAIDKKLESSAVIDLSSNQAKYIIGLDFHTTLSELIYSINSREKLASLHQEYNWFSREDLYNEIDKFSFYSYLALILKPCYEKSTGKNMSIDEFNRASSLTAIENTLKNNKKIKIIHTTDDFLLDESQRKWLENTMGDRLVMLNHGGHCGYMYFKQAADVISKSITPAN